MGVTNIAVDSDGEIYSGKPIKNIRYRHRSLRNKLQRKRTHGSRRRLKKLAGQERRFATWTNHNLSKKIVVTTKRTKRSIALEDLTHIRSRVRARRSQRTTLHSWAFLQLRLFIVYKAALAGVPVHFVDPRNTSRTCPNCGCIDKANRKTQASFVCTRCGLAGHADVIAAGNIASRAAVSPPYYPEASQPRRAGQVLGQSLHDLGQLIGRHRAGLWEGLREGQQRQHLDPVVPAERSTFGVARAAHRHVVPALAGAQQHITLMFGRAADDTPLDERVDPKPTIFIRHLGRTGPRSGPRG
jgi:IS605 OrfB family transposase